MECYVIAACQRLRDAEVVYLQHPSITPHHHHTLSMFHAVVMAYKNPSPAICFDVVAIFCDCQKPGKTDIYVMCLVESKSYSMLVHQHQATLTLIGPR